MSVRSPQHDMMSQRFRTARLACTAVMSVFVWEAVVHGVRCMLGSMGPAVVMTIILSITALHKKVTWRTRGRSSVDQQSLVSFAFAWQGSCHSRAETVVITKNFFYNKQNLLSPIRSES